MLVEFWRDVYRTFVIILRGREKVSDGSCWVMLLICMCEFVESASMTMMVVDIDWLGAVVCELLFFRGCRFLLLMTVLLLLLFGRENSSETAFRGNSSSKHSGMNNEVRFCVICSLASQSLCRGVHPVSVSLSEQISTSPSEKTCRGFGEVGNSGLK